MTYKWSLTKKKDKYLGDFREGVLHPKVTRLIQKH